MRFGFLVLSCLLIAGCAMRPIAPEKAAQYKRVGILSAMGDRFAIGAVGITVFGNDFKAEQLDLGADDILTARASEALSGQIHRGRARPISGGLHGGGEIFSSRPGTLRRRPIEVGGGEWMRLRKS